MVSLSERLLSSPQGKHRQRPHSPLRYQTDLRFTLKNHLIPAGPTEEQTSRGQTDDGRVYVSCYLVSWPVICRTATIPTDSNMDGRVSASNWSHSEPLAGLKQRKTTTTTKRYTVNKPVPFQGHHTLICWALTVFNQSWGHSSEQQKLYQI